MANELIQKAVEVVGGQTALAEKCGKKQGHVSYWLKQEQVTAETALLVDAATSGVVSKYQLRPDIFGEGAAA